MAYYNTCSKCGANLDPGEPCDCEEQRERIYKDVKQNKETGQYSICMERKSKAPYNYLMGYTGRENTR